MPTTIPWSLIVCCQAAAIRLRRQPKKPKKPSALNRSGRAAGMVVYLVGDQVWFGEYTLYNQGGYAKGSKLGGNQQLAFELWDLHQSWVLSTPPIRFEEDLCGELKETVGEGRGGNLTSASSRLWNSHSESLTRFLPFAVSEDSASRFARWCGL